MDDIKERIKSMSGGKHSIRSTSTDRSGDIINRSTASIVQSSTHALRNSRESNLYQSKLNHSNLRQRKVKIVNGRPELRKSSQLRERGLDIFERNVVPLAPILGS